MRRFASIVAAIALLAAITIHLTFHNEPIAELFGDLAFFTLVVAVAAPNGSSERSPQQE